MTPRSAAEVGLKLLGVYWLFSAALYVYKVLFSVFYPIITHSPNSNWFDLSYSLALFLFFALFGYLFAFETDRLLLPLRIEDSDPAEPRSGLTAKGLAGVGLFVLGFYFLVPALVGLFSNCAKLFIPAWGVMDFQGRRLPPYSAIAFDGLQVVLSLILILGRNSIVAIWSRLRDQPKVADDAQEQETPEKA